MHQEGTGGGAEATAEYVHRGGRAFRAVSLTPLAS